MKLNYKRTILIGLAFLSISAFWQLYDSVIPIMLRDTFNLGDTVAGFIMSLDNILALFLLPVFGALSDKAGRRMPFIVWGTLAAATLTVLLPIADQAQNIMLFMAALCLLLLSMSLYRSPAVALMPDVTAKPLRSKGDAVINMMGALGGVFTLVSIQLLSGAPAGQRANYLPLFLTVAVLMLICVLILRLTVNEKKFVQEMKDINYGEAQGQAEKTSEGKLERGVMRSLLLILFSVSFWFMGYNAVTTAFTKYATQMWGQTLSGAATCLLIATIGAVISYIPIGIIASKIGRKKTILMGVAVMALCFWIATFIASTFSPVLYVLFALIGFAWASINVNSYPMVVEISQYGNIGKYTGYYYTFSMAAQIITPILSGWLLEHVGYHTLFPYAAVMVMVSFITMSLAKHGDNKPKPANSKLEAYDAG